MKTKKLFPLLLLFALLITCILISFASPRATDYQATLKAKIDAELAKGAKVVITASRSSSSTTTTISGTVTNVSSSTLTDLVINGMTIKNRGETGFNYSVLDIFNEDKIIVNTLAPNATLNYTFTLEDINWVANGIHGVIFVQAPNSPEKEVLQALYIE
jgi:preprotein translocase subunit YajC